MHIDLHDIIWAVINFLVLVAILYKILYKPITGVMENRTKEIQDNISNAESVKKEAEILRVDINKQLEQARLDAQEIIDKAKKLGEDSKKEIIDEARLAAEKITVKAKKEIEQEREKAVLAIKQEAAGLALLAAAKVLDQEIDADKNKNIVDKYIQEVGEIQ